MKKLFWADNYEKIKIYLVETNINYIFYKSMLTYYMDVLNLENLGYDVILNWTKGIYIFSGIDSVVVSVWLGF